MTETTAPGLDHAPPTQYLKTCQQNNTSIEREPIKMTSAGKFTARLATVCYAWVALSIFGFVAGGGSMAGAAGLVVGLPLAIVLTRSSNKAKAAAKVAAQTQAQQAAQMQAMQQQMAAMQAQPHNR